MAFPIRSSRAVYQINLIRANNDDTPNIIDRTPAATNPETTRIIYVKMKVAIGEWLGLSPLAYNDPAFTGVFQPGGLNAGLQYRRRIGGFKQASYTLVAETFFEINELVTNLETGQVTRPIKRVKTMTIGFPKGHSVTEIINFLASTGRLPDIKGIRSPAGAFTALGARVAPPPEGEPAS